MKYEYIILSYDSDTKTSDIEKMLNTLGNDSWELVSVIFTNYFVGSPIKYYFKRIRIWKNKAVLEAERAALVEVLEIFQG